MDTKLGLGIGWRPELALAIDRRADLGFVEVVAESIDAKRPVPPAIANLQARGVRVVAHGISLSLGSAEPLDRDRVKRLADVADRLDAPLVSEHVAFVRAGGAEAGHLLPVPRTRHMLDILAENVLIARELLPVPLALENVAALFAWPDAEMEEAEFFGQLLDKTDTLMLLDVANVWANARNLGGDAGEFLRRLPLERLAYVHVAGGEERAGVYHDTHAAAVPQGVIGLLRELCAACDPPGVMLERDDHFPSEEQLNAELDAIAWAVEHGATRRKGCHAA